MITVVLVFFGTSSLLVPHKYRCDFQKERQSSEKKSHWGEGVVALLTERYQNPSLLTLSRDKHLGKEVL